MPGTLSCFSRTLVGLKHRVARPFHVVTERFQQNPCGIEAWNSTRRLRRASGFSRTLVGLKLRFAVGLLNRAVVSAEPLWD